MAAQAILLVSIAWLIYGSGRILVVYHFLTNMTPRLNPRMSAKLQQRQIKCLVPLGVSMSLAVCYLLPPALYMVETSKDLQPLVPANVSGFLLLMCQFAALIKLAFASYFDVICALEFDIGQAELLRVGCSWSWLFGAGFAYIFSFRNCGLEFESSTDSYKCQSVEDSIHLGIFDAFMAIVLAGFSISGMRARRQQVEEYSCIPTELTDTTSHPQFQQNFTYSMMVQLSLSLFYHCLFVLNQAILGNSNKILATAQSFVHIIQCGLALQIYTIQTKSILTHMKLRYWEQELSASNSVASARSNDNPDADRLSIRSQNSARSRKSFGRRSSQVICTDVHKLQARRDSATHAMLKGSYVGKRSPSPWSSVGSVDSYEPSPGDFIVENNPVSILKSSHRPQLQRVPSVSSNSSSISMSSTVKEYGGNRLKVPTVKQTTFPIPEINVQMYDVKSRSLDQLHELGSAISIDRSPSSMSDSSGTLPSPGGSRIFGFGFSPAPSPEPMGDIFMMYRDKMNQKNKLSVYHH